MIYGLEIFLVLINIYLTKLRAIEFNKPIIRVSNNGISSIIDKDGNLISKIRLNEKKSINTSLDVRNTKVFIILTNI